MSTDLLCILLQVGNGKRDGKMYTSRCHVHDICKVLMASMSDPMHGEIYNIADDDPSNRETVIQYVRDELIGESPSDSSRADQFEQNQTNSR